MSKLIKDNAIATDDWQVISQDETFDLNKKQADQKVLLPLEQYLANQAHCLQDKNIGLWINSDESTEAIQDFCQQLAVIAINFPVFSDGRGYSFARNLRTYYGYTGELRAIGDILRDQLYFYQRCGFNAFQVRDDRDAEQAIDSLQDFSVDYQSAVEESEPLFNRV